MCEEVRTALDATPESMQLGAPQADAGFLWDFWYPAMRSDEIYGEHRAHGRSRASPHDRAGYITLEKLILFLEVPAVKSK